jgi:hypothetical protein
MARRGAGTEIYGILDKGFICDVAVAYILYLDCSDMYPPVGLSAVLKWESN